LILNYILSAASSYKGLVYLLTVYSDPFRSLTIKIPNKTEAEDIRHQTKEEIVARIQQCADGKDASHKVLAVRQLKSGDLIVHMDNAAGKKEMENRRAGQRQSTQAPWHGNEPGRSSCTA
jgi:hypothetical protein